MEHPLKFLAQHWGLASDHYWHLRLLCSLMLGPLLGTLYLVLFDRRRRPSVTPGPKPAMRVSTTGRLIS